MRETLIELQNIVKTFPGVRAVDDVSLALHTGEVHALVGENGAGKSTLIKVLTGAHQPESGEIVFRGEETVFPTPHRAQQAGISAIYQEFGLIPTLSLADNIFLGHERTENVGGIIRQGETNRLARELLQRVGLRYNPDTLVRELPLSDRQLVEIAKALSYEAQLVIMDEPTAALGDEEVSRLFTIIRRLQADNITILYVSHRLEEIFEIANRVTVMRDGQKIDTRMIENVTEPEIIRMMVGREVKAETLPAGREAGAPLLEVRSLSSRNQVHDISFAVHAGEIVGIAGLIGAGQTMLAKTIFGANPAEDGEIFVGGEPVSFQSPSDAIAAGIGFVPEDRKQEALFLARSLRENLATVQIERFTKAGVFIDSQKEKKNARDIVDMLSIVTPSVEQAVNNLSGGNQQKTALGKWLSNEPKILILDKPTRGVDVGAKAEIHRILRELADQGMGLMMISLELPELLALSDRILVMREGCIAGELAREEATKNKLMELAVGGSASSAQATKGNGQ